MATRLVTPAGRRAAVGPRRRGPRCPAPVVARGRLCWTIAAAAAASTPAAAQQAAPSAAGAAATAVSAAADAPSVAGGGALRRLPVVIVPSVSLLQTFLRGDSQVRGDKRFESITQLSPGVSVSSGTGRVVGFLDYTLNALYDPHGVDGNDIRHALNSSVKAELVEGRAFVDANASVSQQLISARGQQYSNDLIDRGNRTQVTAYSVSPYVRGALGNLATYEGRLNYAASHSGNSGLSDSDSKSALVRLGGGTGLSALSWGLGGSRDVLDYKAGRRTQSDRFSADLGYVVTPQVRVSVRAGRESSDLVSLDKRTETTRGLGASWQPSNLTSLSYYQERRVFGNTHALNFSYRTARTVWTYTDTRDVTTGAAQSALGSIGSVYNLLFQLYASQQPDPVLRDREVRAELQRRGLSPNNQVLAEFLTSAATSQRRQALSAAWLGLRDSATLAFSQSRSNRIDRSSSAIDDLSSSSEIRQQGVSVSLTHRLTPLSSLSLNGSQQRSSGVSNFAASRLSSVDVAWNGQLGRRTSASLSARHTAFSGGAQPYTETAITGGVNLRF